MPAVLQSVFSVFWVGYSDQLCYSCLVRYPWREVRHLCLAIKPRVCFQNNSLSRLRCLGVASAYGWVTILLYCLWLNEHIHYFLTCSWSSPYYTWDVRLYQEYHWSQTGVPLCPTLFGIYIDELESFLHDHIQDGDGCHLHQVLISILLFPNDVVLLASSPKGLQRQLDALALC